MESKLYDKLAQVAHDRVKIYHWINYAYIGLSILGAIIVARSSALVDVGTYYSNYVVDASAAIGIFLFILIPVAIFAIIFHLLINIYAQSIMNNLAKDEAFIQTIMDEQ
ncbi:MAG: hypothetical protein Q4A67_02105 [Aerococcus sp.]|nr:hypothetical protein [Aerococcus sp.]